MFVQGIKSDALLVHAEEIQLTRSVQRIKQAEEVYAGLIEKARRRARGDAGAPERETSSRELKANAREAAAAAAVPLTLTRTLTLTLTLTRRGAPVDADDERGRR